MRLTLAPNWTQPQMKASCQAKGQRRRSENKKQTKQTQKTIYLIILECPTVGGIENVLLHRAIIDPLEACGISKVKPEVQTT